MLLLCLSPLYDKRHRGYAYDLKVGAIGFCMFRSRLLLQNDM